MSPRIPPLPESEWDDRTRELLGRAGVVPIGDADPSGARNIFTTLVRHPRLLRHWLPFGGALLTGSLPARDREIVILRTAWRCRSVYEWGQHVGLGLAAGLTAAEIERIVRSDEAGWSPLERALLHATDELHTDNRVGDATWQVLAQHYDDPQLVEVVMLVGQYHMVAGALNSFGVEREPDVPGFPDDARLWRSTAASHSSSPVRATSPVPAAQHVSSFDGTRLAYAQSMPEIADGRCPVLLLHGFASDHQDNWVEPGIVDALVVNGRVVIASDARGHGASDTPHDPPAYAGNTMVRDAQAILDTLEIERVQVVGYSMGALVAARLAATDPRVHALVIAGAGGNLRRDSTDSGDGGLAAALLVDDPERITHPVGRAFRAFADRAGADRHALAAFERSTALGTDVDFAAITVPTLVLVGDRDQIVGAPEDLARRIAGARAQVVPGDHVGAPRDPAFASALVEFLEGT